MASHGTFHWNERLTRDAESIKTFYQDTIGWTFDSMPTPDGKAYWIATVDGKQVGGIFSIDAPEFDGVSEAWMSYLAVDDVDARITKAVKAGAKLMRPIFNVPEVGRIAMLKEPGGAGIGWITPV